MISHTFEQSKTLCKRTPIESFAINCNQTLQFLSVQIPNLYQKEETLSHLINHKRTRRGIFNGGGYVLNWLFGTPDADDAKYYTDAIHQVELDDKNIQLLLKEQVQVIKSTISNFNDSINSLKMYEKVFNDNIGKLNSFMENTINREYSLENCIQAVEHLSSLTYLVNELSEQYDVLINAILFAKVNVIHPSIITPKNLVHELNKNIKLLTNGRNFPLPLDYDHAYNLLDLSKFKAFFQNHVIVFVIQLPLTTTQVFNLYKLFPLPIPQDLTTYAFIEPTFPFIAMSNNKLQYIQLNDFSQCKKLSDEDMICENHLMYSTLENPICETTLLTSTMKNIPSSCKTRLLRGDIEIWHPLKFNKWIFVLSKTGRLTIDCKDTNDVVDKIIEKTGILTLNEGCRAFSRLTQLIAYSKISTEYHNIIPEIDIIEDECCSKEGFNRNRRNMSIYLSPIRITNVRLDDLKQASHRLDTLDDHIDDLLSKPHIVRYEHWYTIAIKVVAFIVGAFILHRVLSYLGLYKLIRLCCTPGSRQDSSTGCLVAVYNQCFGSSRSRPHQSSQAIAMTYIPEGQLVPQSHCMDPEVRTSHQTLTNQRRSSSRRPISYYRDDASQGFSTED